MLDAAQLTALAQRMSASTQYLEAVHRQVAGEKSGVERATLEQIAAREALLRDKERRLDQQQHEARTPRAAQ